MLRLKLTQLEIWVLWHFSKKKITLQKRSYTVLNLNSIGDSYGSFLSILSHYTKEMRNIATMEHDSSSGVAVEAIWSIFGPKYIVNNLGRKVKEIKINSSLDKCEV